MTTKRFVALARVSSREQEREGFSLAVQEDALRRFAAAADGAIVKFYRIAETASKSDERKTFRALIEFTKDHAGQLDGLLFYKVDRAARNLQDYVELERLESDFDVPFISVSQPTENNPVRPDDAPHARQHGVVLHGTAIRRCSRRPHEARSGRVVPRHGALWLSQRPPRWTRCGRA